MEKVKILVDKRYVSGRVPIRVLFSGKQLGSKHWYICICHCKGAVRGVVVERLERFVVVQKVAGSNPGLGQLATEKLCRPSS